MYLPSSARRYFYISLADLSDQEFIALNLTYFTRQINYSVFDLGHSYPESFLAQHNQAHSAIGYKIIRSRDPFISDKVTLIQLAPNT